jgi:hypothetical protein
MRTTTGTIAPAGRAGSHPHGPAGRRPSSTGAPSRPRDRRSLRDLAEVFARLYLEIECGRRRASQAAGILDRRLAAQLAQVWVRPGPPGVLLAVTGARTAADAYEAVAVVRRGPRVGALALRMARRHGRWLVVHASRPEDGPLPEPDHPVPDDDRDADPFDDLDLALAADAADRMAERSFGAGSAARLA